MRLCVGTDDYELIYVTHHKFRCQLRMKLLVAEQTDTGFPAYVPDVPGCIETGCTREEVEVAMCEVLAFHLEGLRDEGIAAPEPHSYATIVEVAA